MRSNVTKYEKKIELEKIYLSKYEKLKDKLK